MDPTRPGVRTTEFWITLAVAVAGIVAALTGGDADELSGMAEAVVRAAGLLVAAVTSVVYFFTRRAVKVAAVYARAAKEQGVSLTVQAR